MCVVWHLDMCKCVREFSYENANNDIKYMYTRTNYREVVSLMDYTMTNSKAALELPPIELQRAIKMIPSQVSFLSMNYLRAMHVCTCIMRLCSCVDACIIDTLFGRNAKSIDSKALLLPCFHILLRRVHA